MDTSPSTLTEQAERDEQVEKAALPDYVPPASPVRTDAGLGKASALVLALGWPLAWIIAVAVEPAAPTDHVPLVLEVFSLGIMLAMGMLMITAATRKPAALAWAGVTGAALLFSAIACPVSGHHPGIGAWWFVQMAVIGGMVAATAWMAIDRIRSRSAADRTA
jgi:hypothetical protein